MHRYICAGTLGPQGACSKSCIGERNVLLLHCTEMISIRHTLELIPWQVWGRRYLVKGLHWFNRVSILGTSIVLVPCSVVAKCWSWWMLSTKNLSGFPSEDDESGFQSSVSSRNPFCIFPTLVHNSLKAGLGKWCTNFKTSDSDPMSSIFVVKDVKRQFVQWQ